MKGKFVSKVFFINYFRDELLNAFLAIKTIWIIISIISSTLLNIDTLLDEFLVENDNHFFSFIIFFGWLIKIIIELNRIPFDFFEESELVSGFKLSKIISGEEGVSISCRFKPLVEIIIMKIVHLFDLISIFP